tara:strand:- start:287 stop:613 length:327 start_codon:yes stop_codon:yes gene_type:complete
MKATDGAELGRCVFCRDLLYNSEASLQHAQAHFKNSKIVCGNCLLELKDPCLEAFIAKEREESEHNEILLDEVKKYGWKINPATGKLVKIKESKRLIKTQTMGKERGN